MGLDMYAFSVPAGSELSNEVEQEKLAYWRKFNALHGWMEDLYYDKGGKAESFNCIAVYLTLDDLNALEEDLKHDKLTPRSGFFWGDNTIYPEDIESTMDFIEAAKLAIADGRDVYYDSWW